MITERVQLSKEEILRRKAEIVRKYGEWTDHNIHLIDDVYTVSPERGSPKMRRYLQMVADVAQEPLHNLRIADLACLEGLYAVEFARHGATAVGIEGRETSIEKGRFVKEVLGLDNLEFYQDDVRNLSREKYGEFDVVLCSGILYHLDAPDVFRFIQQMHDVCRRFTIIDTYVSMTDKEAYPYNGQTYWGRSVAEHTPDMTADKKVGNLWASLDNNKSVWISRPSLLNVLTDVGFTSVYECSNPHIANREADRITLLAMKGQPQRVISLPHRPIDASADRVPEKQPLRVNPVQSDYYDTSKKISNMVPRFIKKPLKKVLTSVGVLRDGAAQPPWEWNTPWKSRGKG